MPSSASQCAERLDRRIGEMQVALDVQVRDERGFLVDGDEAGATGDRGRMDVPGLAVDEHGARIRPDRAREDLDEGALAGAVGAQQRVDLTPTDLDGRVAQRSDGAVALGDAARVEQQVRGRGLGHRASDV